MKKIWAKQGKVTAKQTKRSKIPPLVISENHRTQIPNMFVLVEYWEQQRLTHLWM